MSDYLDLMIRKIAADRPGQSHENTDQNDVEIEENLFKSGEDGSVEIKNEDTEINVMKFKVAVVPVNDFVMICEKIAPNWKKLAVKLGEEINLSLPSTVLSTVSVYEMHIVLV